ncbi:MAG: DNA-binding response regulator [Nitrospinota bacterium]|nr:MAG: DNA-binding response regulator [Nitrospinota bacterium]
MKVLLIEDSERLRRSLGYGLRREGFTIDSAGDGYEGLLFAETYTYDVLILDLMLPGIDGLALLQRLRAQGNNTPVLILSAKDQVEDRVRGLHLGADDYLIKPFAFEELCARLRALVRRRYGTKNPYIQIGPLTINTNLRQVFHGNTPITLTRKEYMLLEYLALRRGRVFSSAQLCEYLYPHDVDINSNVIEVMIYNIRKKFRKHGVSSVIRTIRGHGYVID